MQITPNNNKCLFFYLGMSIYYLFWTTYIAKYFFSWAVKVVHVSDGVHEVTVGPLTVGYAMGAWQEKSIDK